MTSRIVVDPITRIEGHLRIEAEVKDGKIVDAWSAGHHGARLRDHPEGARPARRVGLHRAGLRRLHDRARPRLGPDRGGRPRRRRSAERRAGPEPDVLRPVPAGPRRPLLPPARARLGGRRQRAEGRPEEDLARSPRASRTGRRARPATSPTCRSGSRRSSESGQLGIFANGYWGHPAYKLPPEVNLLGVAHYLEALEWQKEIVKVHTIFGGKNPHPNYLVGGVPCALNIDDANAINAERLAYVGPAVRPGRGRSSSRSTSPTCWRSRPFYKDWGAIGGGLSNYLAYGDLPTNGFADVGEVQVPARRDPQPRTSPRSCPSTARTPSRSRSTIAHSWYEYARGRRRRAPPVGGRDEAEVHRARSRRTNTSTSPRSTAG